MLQAHETTGEAFGERIGAYADCEHQQPYDRQKAQCPLTALCMTGFDDRPAMVGQRIAKVGPGPGARIQPLCRRSVVVQAVVCRTIRSIAPRRFVA